jgi:hypothetical protein
VPCKAVTIVKDHYPHITRFIAVLFDRGDLPNVRSIDIEPCYGYATRMTYVNGAVRSPGPPTSA